MKRRLTLASTVLLIIAFNLLPYTSSNLKLLIPLLTLLLGCNIYQYVCIYLELKHKKDKELHIANTNCLELEQSKDYYIDELHRATVRINELESILGRND